MCKEFDRTKFLTVPVAQTPNVGIPIGEGRCSAVRLKINAFERNNLNTPIGVPAILGYYGDSQAQECELLAGAEITAGEFQYIISNWTPKIYCKNLEEVFVRSPNGITLQVMIYLSDEDFKS